MFLLISTHFTATLGIPLSPPALKSDSSQGWHWLSLCLSPCAYQTAYVLFTPNNSGQRLPPTYYRGCWHVVSRGFLLRYRHFLLPSEQNFTTQEPSSFTRRCCIRVSPIVQYSPLLPPVGVWTVSQFQCGRSPSQVGYWSSPWWAVTPPTSYSDAGPSCTEKTLTGPACADPALWGINHRFQWLSLCTGQVTYALLTRPPLSIRSVTRRIRHGFPARLACVRHAASVHPEPGSNS